MKLKSVFIDRKCYSLSKLIRIMKLTSFLILVTLMQVTASVYSQNTLLNLNMKNTSLRDVLREIENQSEFTFLYNNTKIDVSKEVDAQFKSSKVEDVLNQVLNGTGIAYVVIEKQVILAGKDQMKSAVEAAQQQQKRITGKVVDQSGSPIPGASVVVKGTTIGITTDNDGNYSLPIAPDAKSIVFSFVGMRSQEVALTGKSEYNVTLTEETTQLEEIVAVGYGTQRKNNLTTSVSTMKNSNLDERAISRVDQALVGQLAGINVKQTTGVPGKAFSIQVRGTGSISAGNEPLYVIDGFPLSTATTNGAGNFATGNPLDNINPNDIESIQVLKDAAAAAIYGSRASNGVILITTKRGKTGKPKITYNTYAGINQATRQVSMLD